MGGMGEGASRSPAARQRECAAAATATDSARIRVQSDGRDTVANAEREPWDAMDHGPDESSAYFVSGISSFDSTYQLYEQWRAQHDHQLVDHQEEREEGGG